MNRISELLVMLPRHKDENWYQELIGRLTGLGIDFLEIDTLPANANQSRAVMLDYNNRLEAPAEKLPPCCYPLYGPGEKVAAGALPGYVANFIEGIIFDARLTIQHPARRKELMARDNKLLLNDLLHGCARELPLRWFDATSYDISALWDGISRFGNRNAMNEEQLAAHIDQMFAEEPYNGSDCDQIAPLYPITQMALTIGRTGWLDISRKRLYEYWRNANRRNQVITSYDIFANTVRGEPMWQAFPPLVQLSRLENDMKLGDEIFTMFERYIELLFDQEKNLFHHGRSADKFSAGFWCRGQAFTVFACLRVAEEFSYCPRKSHDLAALAARQLAALETYIDQVSGGVYHLIDCPDSDFDPSGVAWLAACCYRGSRLGLLPPKRFIAMADKLLGFVKSRIIHGRYVGTATGTTVSARREYYAKNLPNYTGWSHFAAMAIMEAMDYERDGQ